MQLYIEIKDRDNSSSSGRYGSRPPDDLVDTIMIAQSVMVGESQRENHRSSYGFVTMDLNITVLCAAEHFEGPDCTECVPGFTGTDCQTNIDDCEDVDCSRNGQCLDGVNSFTCECAPGYTGLLCDTQIEGNFKVHATTIIGV